MDDEIKKAAALGTNHDSVELTPREVLLKALQDGLRKNAGYVPKNLPDDETPTFRDMVDHAMHTMLLEVRKRAPMATEMYMIRTYGKERLRYMAIEFMKNGGDAQAAIQSHGGRTRWNKKRERSLTIEEFNAAVARGEIKTQYEWYLEKKNGRNQE